MDIFGRIGRIGQIGPIPTCPISTTRLIFSKLMTLCVCLISSSKIISLYDALLIFYRLS